MKGLARARLQLRVFGGQAVIVAMRAQEDIGGQRLQHPEGLFIILRDVRILLVADQNIAGIDIGAAHDHHIQRLAAIRSPAWSRWCSPWCGPASCARSAPCRPARRCRRHAAPGPPWSRIEIHAALVAIVEVELAAGFHHRHVAIHHFIFGAGVLDDLGSAGVMVEMGVADQKDLGVGIFEAQLGDAGLDHRRVLLGPRIDQDVARGRGDQIVRLTLGADDNRCWR